MLKFRRILAISLLPFSLAFLSTCTMVDKTFTDEDSKGFTGSISGVVTSKHGTTLSGVLVTVSPGGQTTVSTSGGKFEISGITPGSHSLSYVKSDYVDTTSSDSVTVGLLDSVVLDSDQQLTYMYATVTGTITDSIGTSQLTGTTVGVSVENQTASFSTSSGTFILAKVEPGTVRLFAAISGTGYGYLDTVVSSDDTLKGLKVRVSRKGGTVTGTVVDSSRNAQSGVTVSAVGGALTSTTGSDGSYTLTTVPSEGSVQLVVTSTTGDTVGTASVSVDEGDSAEVPAVVVGDEGLGNDLLKVLPSTVVVSDTSDTLTLVATALWSSDDDKPCWFLWSMDGGDSWDTTRVSSYEIAPSVLADLLDAAECGSEYCSFEVKVKGVNVYGLSSDVATITAEVKRTEALSSSSSSNPSLSLVSSSSSISKDWFNSAISYGTMTDERDGQTYRTVVIGTQMWMAENLNYGTMISASSNQQDDSVVEKYCYDDNMENCETYGGLYQWAEAMAISSQYNTASWSSSDTLNHQGICPVKWHIPTATEMLTLTNYVDESNDAVANGNEGISLRANSDLWSNVVGTDLFGFASLPAGFRNIYSASWYLGDSTYYWYSIESSVTYAMNLHYEYGGDGTVPVSDQKINGYSIRCIYDTTIVLSSSSESSSSSIEISSSSEEFSSSEASSSSSIIVSSSIEAYSSSSASESISSAMPSSSSEASSSSIEISSSSEESSSSSFDWDDCVSAGNCGTFTDSRDGLSYKYTTIGTQTWMAENLNYDTLNDSGSWCYNDTASYCDTYGRLYNWSTAMAVDTLFHTDSILGDSVNHRGICPEGWHVPSSAEWDTLVNYVGGEDVAGTYLMANSNLWSTNSGTDDYGFSALPGGRYGGSPFYGVGYYGYWWTAAEYSSTGAYGRGMHGSSANVNSSYYDKSYGFSLRCVEDSE